jgi:hypothetical protein
MVGKLSSSASLSQPRLSLATAIGFFILAMSWVTPNLALDPPHDASNGIGCGSCHSMHFGFMPHGEELEAMCKSCHNPAGMASEMHDVANHVVSGGALMLDCGACHTVHKPETSVDSHPGGIEAVNLSLIRPDTDAYYPGALTPAVFQQSPDHLAFGEGNPPWNGICQSCHTKTIHHRNNGSVDHAHEMATLQTISCTVCHAHGKGFLVSGGCVKCHSAQMGTRRQITGEGADFDVTSHHVQGDPEDDDCLACHNVAKHKSGTVRLRDGDLGDAKVYEYDPEDPSTLEPFCIGCHDADGATDLGGQPFTDGAFPPNVAGLPGSTWVGSAHNSMGYAANNGKPLSCFGDGVTTGCHGNGHGSENVRLLAGDLQETVGDTCLRCHTEGMVANNALSGPELADDIEEAFSLSEKHDLGSTITIGESQYQLDCTSCHNPHIVSGRHDDTGKGLSPITRPNFSDPVKNPRAVGSQLWGATAGQKMDDYAAEGIYRAPNPDTLDGTALPDYVTFCLDCHGPMKEPNGGISWGNDNHGLKSANVGNGGGKIPDWYSAGKGLYWDGDDCIAEDEKDCWPVISRNKGEMVFSRRPYNQEERMAGGNFVLSCSDCHESHGGNAASMLRSSLNDWEGSGTQIWNSSCNACHYYYSDWHAGMSCGNASCHTNPRLPGSSSIHGMNAASGSNATRFWDPDLVGHYKFDKNLNDAGTWRMHGRWFDQNTGYSSGKSGYAAVFDGDSPIEVGTRNEYWSTDEGKHGTWKYTEMKYNMTLESWVFPTDSTNEENLLFAKHTYNDGGYAFMLRRINGTLRAALLTNVTGGAPTWGENSWDAVDCNGLRGAFSTVAVPLNQWTHVAVTFDSALPDRDAADLSQGRIRIYVNGEDVTTSNADISSCLAQPGPGEEHMFPYSDHSPDNEGICYVGHWCGSALSLGGVMWGSGGRKGLIGRMDDAKIWNVTKEAEFFDTVDESSPPRIDAAWGEVGSPTLAVSFSEGVWGANEGPIVADDLVLTDLDGRSIVQVSHTPGDPSLLLQLSSPLSPLGDFGLDLLSASAGSIFDEYGNGAGIDSIVIQGAAVCPDDEVIFNFSEDSGATHVLDSQGLLVGVVADPSDTLTGGGMYSGDGVNNNIAFNFAPDCLTAASQMTLEVRVKPTVVDSGEGSTVQRIFARDDFKDYQMSIWRSVSEVWTPTFQPPAGVASVAFWLPPVDPHGGSGWKPVLTDYTICPIQADHWYRIRLVFDSLKEGGIPADFFVDDQGPAGNNIGEAWAGFVNCTDWQQNQIPEDRRLYEGDQITTAGGSFAVGANVNNLPNNQFSGLIDYVIWKAAPDFTGVDGGPLP